MQRNPNAKVWERDELPRSLQGRISGNENREPAEVHDTSWICWTLMFAIVALMVVGLTVDRRSAHEIADQGARMIRWFDGEAMRYMLGNR